MLEMYLMLFLCIIIALFVGILAVTIYLGWVFVMNDLEQKQKEEDNDTGRNY